jgi:short-subunit dehydrogenase
MNHPQHILITGATGGIGGATARAVAGRGVRLSLVARDAVRLATLQSELEGRASTVAVFSADLTDAASRSALVEQAIAAHGPIDVLVNCAGVNAFQKFAAAAPESVERMILTNVLAPMLLTRAVLPGMIARRRGRIVNIGSVMGGIGFAGFAAYCGSKFGLRGFSEALRRELRGSGVEVTYVAPRYTKTALNTGAMDRMARAVGMKIDEPQAVARAIAATIDAGKAEHTIGGMERLLFRLNALFPRLVDTGLATLNRRMLDHVEPAEPAL